MITVSEDMAVCNIKELPSVYKDQLGERLDSYKMIGVFDKFRCRPLKIYIHFMDFLLERLTNMLENLALVQISNLHLYRLVDLVFDENGKIIKDRYPPI